MNRFHRFLRWLRIEDRQGKLSLTTVAFVVACYCFVAGKGVTVDQLGAFVVAVAAHRQRQHVDQVAPVATPEASP
jgi:hypothetical protein